uniref:Uncharacterized protein n=1 Tax=Amphimedon queenslandica TaxID=400682 RepID=A0A1X7UL23_AMPQE
MQQAEIDNFYYSLIFFFGLFTDESTLVMEGKKWKMLLGITEKHLYVALRIISSNCQKLLEAERHWNKIVNARNKACFTEQLFDNKKDDEPQLLG